MPEREVQRLRRVRHTHALGLITAALARLKLLAGLFAITNTVICTERDLLAIWEQDFLAAFHHVLLVKRPGIHEILQHDHENVSDKSLKVQSTRDITCGA